MAETNLTKKGDFVELEFIGRNNLNKEVFDTNILEEARKINPNIKETKPLVLCIGKEMVVKGFDESLEGKELGKKYSITLNPDKAFGKRNPSMIKLIPIRLFHEQKVYPQAGMTLSLDNAIVKIISVSGGRVMVDFNNPLAGKDVEYEFTINKKIEDQREKIDAVQKFLYGQVFEYDIENNKIVFKDLKLTGLLQALRPQFREFLDMDVEILEKAKKEEPEAKDAQKETK